MGLPPDVILTRMAVDNRLPVNERRNYKHVFDGFRRIYVDEGILTLYRGAVPTICRAVVVNVSQVVSYFEAKHFLLRNGKETIPDMYMHVYAYTIHILKLFTGIVSSDNSICQLSASLISSAVATTCTLPVDITKTRIQNMGKEEGGVQYKNMVDVWYKIIRYEGIFALWKGFTPLFVRNAPQFIVTFITYEKFIHFFSKLGG